MEYKGQKLSKLLIGIGILVMCFSFYQANQWRFVQKDLILVEEPIIEELNQVLEESIEEIVIEQETTIDNYDGLVKRSEYEDGLITIEVPKLDINASVLNGTTDKILKSGPGLYENSPLHEGLNPNICIAAHRTTYGAWFKNVDDLEPGEQILLSYEGKKFEYEVVDVFIVEKNDWSITEQQDYSALTLTTCHPPYSDAQRLVVRGKLIEILDI